MATARRTSGHSVPDALASAAQQLVGKGWQRGTRWAFEVHAPKGVDCTIGVPAVTHPLGEWLKQGFVPAYGRKPAPAELGEPASLLHPEGTYGPAFLTLKNYYVIKEYNFSDLYVLFVGHLSERISDSRPFETPWSQNAQLRTAQVETMQRTLTKLGLYKDKIDGKAGMLTRSALGAYQKANQLKVDCWPTAAVLEDMQRRAAKNRTGLARRIRNGRLARAGHDVRAGRRLHRERRCTESRGPMREGPIGSRRCAAAQQATRTGLTTHACHRLDHTS